MYNANHVPAHSVLHFFAAFFAMLHKAALKTKTAAGFLMHYAVSYTRVPRIHEVTLP